jgi:hypothetical protein
VGRSVWAVVFVADAVLMDVGWVAAGRACGADVDPEGEEGVGEGLSAKRAVGRLEEDR